MYAFHAENVPAVSCGRTEPEPVHFAATELRHYLGRILGVDIPGAAKRDLPVIRLRTSADPELGDEGYEFTADGRTLCITGGGPLGVVFGVYEFLRRYAGCRFSGLAPDGELIPRKQEVRVDELPLRKTPSLWYRGFQFYSQPVGDLTARRIDWMAKNGMNYVLISPMPDLDDTWDGQTLDPATGQGIGSVRKHRYTVTWYRERILPEITKRGLKVDMNHHNLLTWLPPELYFERHPEWFALRNGERSADPHQFCICTSNRDAVAEVIANIKQFLRENPEVSIVGLIPEDGVGCCQCEACRALDIHPDDALTETPLYGGAHKYPEAEKRSKIRRYAMFANDVARAIRDHFPDVLLGTAAYYDIQWPPRDVKLETNIVPWVAIYWRCGAHELATGSCRVNAFFFDVLGQWRKAHRHRLILYEYYMGMGAQAGLPYPQAGVICREWPLLKKLGIDGATVQSMDSVHEAYALNYLAFARSGWEAQVAVDTLQAEYLEGMFGAAAPALRPIFERLEAQCRKIERGEAESPYLATGWGGEGCLLPNGINIGWFLGDEGFTLIDKQVDEARQLASSDRERRQIDRFENATRYWHFMFGLLDTRRQMEGLQQDGDGKAAAILAAEAYVRYGRTPDALKDLYQADGWTMPFNKRLSSQLGAFRQQADPPTLVKLGKLVLEVYILDKTFVRAECDGVREPGAMLTPPREAFKRVADRTLQVDIGDPGAVDIRVNGEPLDVQNNAAPCKIRLTSESSPAGTKVVSSVHALGPDVTLDPTQGATTTKSAGGSACG